VHWVQVLTRLPSLCPPCEQITEHCSFEYMKSRADKMAPFGGGHMTTAKAFFVKGPARDFRTELGQGQIEAFDRAASEQLGAECARWLEQGGRAEH
jgi:aryl sulfotransferase